MKSSDLFGGSPAPCSQFVPAAPTDWAASELVKLLLARRQARYYRLEIWPDLFGGYSLAREYGRIGQSGRLQLEPFPEIDTATRAFTRIVRTKQHRGYVVLAEGGPR